MAVARFAYVLVETWPNSARRGTRHAAEDYHQDFLLKNPNHPYIVINDLPKIRNFKSTLPELYQGKPVTAAQN